MTESTPEQPPEPTPQDETSPVIATPEPATGAATFAAETPDHTVVPAGTEPTPQATPEPAPQPTPQTVSEPAPVPATGTDGGNPGALTEIENVTGDVESLVRDVRNPGDVVKMIEDIHKMVSDVHGLLSDVEPAIRKVVDEVNTKGLPGLLSLFMGGGR